MTNGIIPIGLKPINSYVKAAEEAIGMYGTNRAMGTGKFSILLNLTPEEREQLKIWMREKRTVIVTQKQ